MMEQLPEFLINKVYKYRHEMSHYKIMKQLKTYSLNTIFLASLEFLEYGYFKFEGTRIPSINIDNINATSQEILCLINTSGTLTYRWSRPYGGSL